MTQKPKPRRGKPANKPEWQPISLKLPAALVADIDAIAAQERRARVKMIEVVLAQFVESYRQKSAA